MSVIQVRTRYEGTRVINTDTGELITTVPSDKKKAKPPSFTKYIGEETKHPADCITQDSLLASLSIMDMYVKNKPFYNSHYLAESIIKKLITPKELEIIDFICKNITGWNYYIGNIKDMYHIVKPNHLSGVIDKLSPYSLRVLHKDKPFKGDIVIKVNPIITWKGNLEYREAAIKPWYTGSSDELLRSGVVEE